MKQSSFFDLSSAGLHLLAMGLMLCDHLGATLFPAAEWLTCLGRLSFPIFAFLLVEGFFHTHDLRAYLLRLLGWAVLSELPFNLIYGGSLLYPYHQNVLWTLLLGLCLIALMERVKGQFSPLPAFGLCTLLTLAGFLLGFGAMTDYYGVGVLTILTFYFFRERSWKCFLGQLICLGYLNLELLGGLNYTVNLWGHEVEFAQQGLALLALIPIWLYRGRKGYSSKGFRLLCYGFYPGHMLILYGIRMLALR